MTKTINLTKEEAWLLFDLILDNFPEDKQIQHKYATIYNKIGGVIKRLTINNYCEILHLKRKELKVNYSKKLVTN